MSNKRPNPRSYPSLRDRVARSQTARRAAEAWVSPNLFAADTGMDTPSPSTATTNSDQQSGEQDEAEPSSPISASSSVSTEPEEAPWRDDEIVVTPKDDISKRPRQSGTPSLVPMKVTSAPRHPLFELGADGSKLGSYLAGRWLSDVDALSLSAMNLNSKDEVYNSYSLKEPPPESATEAYKRGGSRSERAIEADMQSLTLTLEAPPIPGAPYMFKNSDSKVARLEIIAQFANPVFIESLGSNVRELDLQKVWRLTELMPGHLPSTLRKLRLGRIFNEDLPPGVLPSGLKEMDFNTSTPVSLSPGVFPEGMVAIDMHQCENRRLPPGVFPVGLKRLALSNRSKYATFMLLPPSLEVLWMPGSRDEPLGREILPGNLRYLEVNDLVLPPRISELPARLRVLRVKKSMSRLLSPNDLPQTLEFLELSNFWTKEFVEGVLPRSLTHLVVHGSAVDFHPGELPQGLRVLILTDRWQGVIHPGALPSSLKILSLPYNYNRNIPDKVFDGLRLQKVHIPRGGVISTKQRRVFTGSASTVNSKDEILPIDEDDIKAPFRRGWSIIDFRWEEKREWDD